MNAKRVKPGDVVLVSQPLPWAPGLRLRASAVYPEAEYAVVRWNESVTSDATHRARRRLTFTDGTVATTPTTSDWITLAPSE